MRRNTTAAWLVAALSAAMAPVNAKSDEGFLVLRRGEVLEAIRADGSQRQVLRRKFTVGNEGWDISRDGRRVCFTRKPQDIQFNSARDVRSYLFVLDHDKPVPQVLLRAYGAPNEGTAQGVTSYSYKWPSFDPSGSKVLVTEDKPGDSATGGSLAIHEIATRAQTWSSFQMAGTSPLLAGTIRPNAGIKRLYGAALSPSGQHILCGATTTAERGTDSGLFESDWKHYLVHFDLQKQAAQVLAAFDWDIEGIAWSQDSQRFALSGLLSGSMADIYTGELGQSELQRLTHDTSHDINPLWNRSGTRLFWLSNRRQPGDKPLPKASRKSLALPNRLFSMKLDSSNQRRELPRVTSIDSVRRVDSLPSWRRFREKQVFAAIGIKS